MGGWDGVAGYNKKSNIYNYNSIKHDSRCKIKIIMKSADNIIFKDKIILNFNGFKKLNYFDIILTSFLQKRFKQQKKDPHYPFTSAARLRITPLLLTVFY